ncbi:MAG: FG-GAP-like repeat-containing protein, partial [Leptospira sp.]|nr:FG-GAP-like repeat-containing protein [Leptospira sp.]
ILAQQGIVYIFYGGSSGIAATSPSQANVSISGKAGSDQFGSYLTIGDLNGDGFGDLMVGAFGRNAGAGGGQGEVYIFHGSKNGITITSAFAANTTLTASSAGDNLGGGVMFISDINGDGFGDAVVGITGGPTANNNGQIVIFHGSSSGIASTTNPAGSANTTLTGLATNEGFGVGLDCADLNGDGFSDLVAGSLFRNAGAGANQGEAYIFYGKSSGISSGLASTANITMTGSGSGLKFGSTVSVNDYNGDNFLDFAIGGSGYSAGTGKVYIFNGSSAGFSSKNSDNADVIITGSTAAENFGFSSASGDFNGDGFADLVVGANLFTTSQGRAYIFHGSATGIAVTNSSSASTIITGISSNDQTGETVSSLYLNGDGFSDLLVGSSNYSAGNAQGRVYIFNGMSAGIPS